MGIRSARHKGKISIRGRPREVAKAEIMVMKQKERQEDRKRRRMLFNFLDIVIVLAFALAIYSVYVANYTNAVLFLIIGGVPLIYFIVRRVLRDKSKRR